MINKEKLQQKMSELMYEFDVKSEGGYENMEATAKEIRDILVENAKSDSEERIPVEVFSCFSDTMFNSLVMAWLAEVLSFCGNKQAIFKERHKPQAEITSDIQAKLKELSDAMSDEHGGCNEKIEKLRCELFDMLESPHGQALPADILSVIDVENRSTILMGWLNSLAESLSPEVKLNIGKIDIAELLKQARMMSQNKTTNRGDSDSHAE